MLYYCLLRKPPRAHGNQLATVLPRLRKKQFETTWVPQILILLTHMFHPVATSKHSQFSGFPSPWCCLPCCFLLSSTHTSNFHLMLLTVIFGFKNYSTALRETKLPSVFSPSIPAGLRGQLLSPSGSTTPIGEGLTEEGLTKEIRYRKT